MPSPKKVPAAKKVPAKVSSRGGFRPNAGRPTADGAEGKKVTVSFQITEEDREFFDEQPGGRSACIRQYAAALKKRKGWVPAAQR